MSTKVVPVQNLPQFPRPRFATKGAHAISDKIYSCLRKPLARNFAQVSLLPPEHQVWRAEQGEVFVSRCATLTKTSPT